MIISVVSTEVVEGYCKETKKKKNVMQALRPWSMHHLASLIYSETVCALASL